MRQRFRANLEIASCPAFWEDRQFSAPGEIVTFRVGTAKLIGTNSCKRCVAPTRDPSCAGELAVSQRKVAVNLCTIRCYRDTVHIAVVFFNPSRYARSARCFTISSSVSRS